MDHHFKSEFVRESSLAITDFPGEFMIAGHISCPGMIVIKVRKFIEILETTPNPLVVTREYAYNAFVAGHQSFLRHDNIHVHDGHHDEHHYHRFDWRTGEPLEPPVWCGVDGWPNLSEFIDKVHEWYVENHADLPDGSVSDLSVYDAREAVI